LSGSERAALVRQLFPELAGLPVSASDSGQNNDVLILGGELVFRFPKNADGLRRIAVECAILSRIAGRLSLPVPNPLYANLAAPAGQAFMGYRLLPGQPMRPSAPLTDEGWRRAAGSVGRFLRQLHGLPLGLLDGIELRDGSGCARWEAMYGEIRAKLLGFMRDDAKAQVTLVFERLLESLRGAGERGGRALVHGDFGPGNVLYDADAGAVSGVIDFGSAGIGDPAVDLGAMIGPFGYGEQFLRWAGAEYPGLDRLVERARLYAGTFALQEALHGVEHGDEDAFRRGMAPYV
jgi:aminoglycoside 2''-phosphotransferase